MKTLAGKTAVVTGASRGIGRAAALALAKAGAQVIVHYGHGAGEAEAVVREIRRIGSRSSAVAVDLCAPDGPHRLASQVRAIVGGRLDILVANAAISSQAVVNEMSVEDFDLPFALNVRAPYFLVQQLLPIMCKGSSITFLRLPAPHVAAAMQPADAAIGGAIRTLVRHFAFALGERGVRVNALAKEPAQAETPAFARTAGSGRLPRRGASGLRAGADGVGSAVAFLASDAARWVTGDIVEITGNAEF